MMVHFCHRYKAFSLWSRSSIFRLLLRNGGSNLFNPLIVDPSSVVCSLVLFGALRVGSVLTRRDVKRT